MDAVIMGYQTRDLMPYAFSRTLMDTVIFIFSSKTFNDDGSFDIVPEEIEKQARVIDLQPIEIERLRENGINLNKGKNISIVETLETIPDLIKINDELFRVIQPTPREGVTILLVDSLPGVI